MWWKLFALGAATIVVILCVIPIRSQAVKYDMVADGTPPRTGLTAREMLANMYLTPGTIILIGLILVVAALLTWRIIRAGQ